MISEKPFNLDFNEGQVRKMGLRAEQKRLMRLAAKLTKYRGNYRDYHAAVFVQRAWRLWLEREYAWADALYG